MGNQKESLLVPHSANATRKPYPNKRKIYLMKDSGKVIKSVPLEFNSMKTFQLKFLLG